MESEAKVSVNPDMRRSLRTSMSLLRGFGTPFLLVFGFDAQVPRRIPVEDALGPTIVFATDAAAAVVDSDDTVPTTFTAMTAAVSLSNQSILKAESGTRELREFDQRGRFVKLWGARGRGPGEFESIAWLSVGQADTVYVYDRAQRRVSQFVTGRFIAQRTLAELSGATAPMDAVGVTPDGYVVLRTLLSQPAALGSIRSKDALQISSFARQNAQRLMPVEGDEIYFRASSAGGQIPGTPPFQRRTLVAAGRGVIATGDSESGEITFIRYPSLSRRTLRVGASDTVLSASDIAARLEALWGDKASPRRDAWEKLQREMITRRVLPAIAGLHFDERNQLWVIGYDRSQKGLGRAVILSADGAVIGRSLLPLNCRVAHIHARSIGCIGKDSDGREGAYRYDVTSTKK